MTDNSTRPGCSSVARAALVATLLIVAGSALGCGADEQAPEGIAHVGSHGGRSAIEDPDPALGPSFDTSRPTIGNLDPELLDAVRAAAHDAHEDGVELSITSGWRSRDHQQRLLDDAVSRYGSLQEALRYVSTPDTSAHVTGDAVDIGPTDAADWLIRHGADYGLCQIFANEIWHFELATTPGGVCPDLLPDSSYRQ